MVLGQARGAAVEPVGETDRGAQRRRHNVAELHVERVGASLQDGDVEIDVGFERIVLARIGGDQQLGALIAEGRIDALIFFVDALSPHPHDVDVKALIRMATLAGIPLACNRATADAILRACPIAIDPQQAKMT